MSLSQLSIVMPTCLSRDLALIALSSFKKFCPEWLELRFIVVENSDNNSYKDEIERLGACWISNPTIRTHSWANASGIEIGLRKVDTEHVFLCHCDVMVTHPLFFETLRLSVDLGESLLGTVRDPVRINAIHISGLLTTTALAKSVNMDPRLDEMGSMVMDVGDALTAECRQLCLEHRCLQNTFNDPGLINSLQPPFSDFAVDRCVVDGKVVFMHLGRGIDKTRGHYNKSGKISLNDWISFADACLS